MNMSDIGKKEYRNWTKRQEEKDSKRTKQAEPENREEALVTQEFKEGVRSIFAIDSISVRLSWSGLGVQQKYVESGGEGERGV